MTLTLFLTFSEQMKRVWLALLSKLTRKCPRSQSSSYYSATGKRKSSGYCKHWVGSPFYQPCTVLIIMRIISTVHVGEKICVRLQFQTLTSSITSDYLMTLLTVGDQEWVSFGEGGGKTALVISPAKRMLKAYRLLTVVNNPLCILILGRSCVHLAGWYELAGSSMAPSHCFLSLFIFTWVWRSRCSLRCLDKGFCPPAGCFENKQRQLNFSKIPWKVIAFI